MVATAGTGVTASKRSGRRPQIGPPPLAPVLAFTVPTIGYVVVNRSTPHFDASARTVLVYDLGHGTALRLGSALLLASAITLVLMAAVLYRRLRTLGITAPGPAITLVGGIAAAIMLTVCATASYVSGRLAGGASPALAKAIADLSFFSGGPAFAVMFALLVFGLSATGLNAGLLPKVATVPGLVIAVVGVLAVLSPVASGFSYLVPVVRFGGLVWLIAVAPMLPQVRRRATA
ncbi:DUF4386 domain-containing protein [Streptomyces sp. HPF1205]|uniref:DUF4386 domain-containing protein n=1 Tax=Streptomyces sp. HPF1205 TaxID=2873262 RepID=UPI001CEC33D9|nr:DUF4386 domain-containing protein [Streptomyces sp. HPF1205]